MDTKLINNASRLCLLVATFVLSADIFFEFKSETHNSLILQAREYGSLAGTRNPVTLFSINEESPPTLQAITGTPDI